MTNDNARIFILSTMGAVGATIPVIFGLGGWPMVSTAALLWGVWLALVIRGLNTVKVARVMIWGKQAYILGVGGGMIIAAVQPQEHEQLRPLPIKDAWSVNLFGVGFLWLPTVNASRFVNKAPRLDPRKMLDGRPFTAFDELLRTVQVLLFIDVCAGTHLLYWQAGNGRDSGVYAKVTAVEEFTFTVERANGRKHTLWRVNGYDSKKAGFVYPLEVKE